MKPENENENEIENETLENGTIEDLINSIEKGDYRNAENVFNGIMDERLEDSLNQAKVKVADSIFNRDESEDENHDSTDD